MTLIHARGDDALANGSFLRQVVDKTGRQTIWQYMNGDFINCIPELPEGLRCYSLRDAKKLLPKICGGTR